MEFFFSFADQYFLLKKIATTDWFQKGEKKYLDGLKHKELVLKAQMYLFWLNTYLLAVFSGKVPKF